MALSILASFLVAISKSIASFSAMCRPTQLSPSHLLLRPRNVKSSLFLLIYFASMNFRMFLHMQNLRQTGKRWCRVEQ